MSKRVYLFFNHPAEDPPEGDKWNNWTDPDTTKLAWFCAESWRRQGWQVERMSTLNIAGFTPFTGQLRQSMDIYPLEYFNFWYAAKLLSPAWFTTIDVFNYGFTPHIASLIEPQSDCITHQSQHFSASCLWLTPPAIDAFIELILRYDAGHLPRIPIPFVSDETVIRHYGCQWHYDEPRVLIDNTKLCRYAIEPDASDAILIHAPRSTLSRLFPKSLCSGSPDSHPNADLI